MKKNDNFYKNFYNPTDAFKEEPRAFCYDLSQELIEKAKIDTKNDWYTHEKTIEAILLLLYCWNFASMKTKQLTRKKIRRLLKSTENKLKKLEDKTILDFRVEDEKFIKKIYRKFKQELGQTGASKALSLMNQDLFVMWDTKIRKKLRKKWIRGIDNGQKAKHYIAFLKGIREIIKKYNLGGKINSSSSIAKKIDEYHYVELVMKK